MKQLIYLFAGFLFVIFMSSFGLVPASTNNPNKSKVERLEKCLDKSKNEKRKRKIEQRIAVIKSPDAQNQYYYANCALIFGILSFIPSVSIMAIIYGIKGLKAFSKWGDNYYRKRSLIGLVLGIAWLVIWGLIVIILGMMMDGISFS